MSKRSHVKLRVHMLMSNSVKYDMLEQVGVFKPGLQAGLTAFQCELLTGTPPRPRDASHRSFGASMPYGVR